MNAKSERDTECKNLLLLFRVADPDLHYFWELDPHLHLREKLNLDQQ